MLPSRVALRRHALTLAGVALLASIALAGCGSSSSGGADPGPSGSSSASSAAGQTITLYNGQHEQTTDALVAGFEKSTGINVKVRNDDEDVFDNEIQTEGSHSPADVIYTENTPALEFLQEHDLLAPVDPSTLAHTPTRFNSPQGDWVGVSARVSVLDYNPSMISANDLPKTSLAMADPKYKGLLAIAPGETDFQPIVTSMIKQYGTARTLQWLEGLKANAGSNHSYPDNETIASDINSGKVAFGVINQYYWYRLGAQIGTSNYHSKLAYFAPHDPGYVLNVSGAGVLASSKHQAAAQQFLAYLVSKQGQEIITHSDSFEYPIASGVTATSAPETPFSQLQPNPIDIAQLGDGQAAINLLKQAQLL
jgi:iron(III) transport system substrate-binding protein